MDAHNDLSFYDFTLFYRKSPPCYAVTFLIGLLSHFFVWLLILPSFGLYLSSSKFGEIVTLLPPSMFAIHCLDLDGLGVMSVGPDLPGCVDLLLMTVKG